MTAGCPRCGEPIAPDDRYCEACGHPVPTTTQPSTSDSGRGRWSASTGTSPACPGCGGTAFGAEGYCETCGQRRPAGADHVEIDLGAAAAVTDTGLRHRRNEDATGIGTAAAAGQEPGGEILVAVVCDGVSSSPRADTAARAAVSAATPLLVDRVGAGTPPEGAIEAAAAAAAAAVAALGGGEPAPPSCTLVCAVVGPGRVTVGWVGDSRAYWVPDGGSGPAAACLTVDDSLAGQLAAADLAVPEAALGPQATALVRWLGADAGDTRPHLRSFTPDGPGRVIVCSDGLSRYCPTPADLAAAVPDAAPLDAARALVRFAVDRGGHDNVTAVVLPARPTTPPTGGPTRG